MLTHLQWLDWFIIIAYFAMSLVVGLVVSRRAGINSEQFFLSGRSMPWWLLGISMVATTFSNSTPNLVTDIVRTHGISGNWLWWAFLLTGMLTVFIYAQLWRRSGVLTDLEFYELRYSGRSAAFLRGFRAIYLGVFFNTLIMADCSLAAIKLGGVIFGYSPVWILVIAGSVTVVYSMFGGLMGVLVTDLFQFAIAMIGSILVAWFVLQLPEVGGLSAMLSHPQVFDRLDLLPDFSDRSTLLAVFIIPLAVQWWSVWYPGSEPGGGGYIAQRMLAARNERHAVGATLFFNFAHYALRPWPWILVALASLIVFPDADALRRAFPTFEERLIRNDMAYPAMLTLLPAGLLGFVLASLLAAYMSTISTHLNWGSSYVVNDFYRRFFRRTADERELVFVGRVSTLFLMILGSGLALLMRNSLQAFNLLLQVGAGTGLLFILRWFWWRINAWSEVAAMVISFLVACYFQLVHARLGFAPLSDWQVLLIGVAITTTGWIIVTLITPPSDERTLWSFYRLARPGGPGWRPLVRRMQAVDPQQTVSTGWNVPRGIVCMFLGCCAVYSTLFATGCWIYGDLGPATMLSVVAVVAFLLLWTAWKWANAHNSTVD